MASVLAIVSKAVFEKEAPQTLGEVWATKGYASKHVTLDVVKDRGAIFLVTVRPPDERLWLVGILEAPKRGTAGWSAAPNTIAIRDVTAAKAKLRFANGAGITAKPGALGMSLQTPRVLAEEDVALLRGAAVSAKSMAKESSRPPAVKLVATPLPTTKASAVGDDASAVAELLALWRSTHVPAIADVLDAIGARTISTAPDSKLPTKQAIPAWLAWAKKLRDVDVPAAIASFDAARIHSRPALERLELLGTRKPDPRIGRFLVGLLADPPFQSTGTQKFWRRLFKLVPPHLDAQTLAALAKLTSGGVRRVGAKTMGQWFDKELGKLVPAVRVPPPTGTFDPAPWLARFTAPRGDSRRDDLFAAVYAAPDDDEPRLVLADFLQQENDPHGELIALQLAPASAARDARIAELLDEHGKDFAPPAIAKVLKETRFERGFLAAGRLDPRTGGELRRAIGAPGWETVRQLHLGYFSADYEADVATRHELLAAPVMRHLAELWVDAEAWTQLARLGGTFPWRTLVITERHFADWSEAFVRAQLPKLDQLAIVMDLADKRAAAGTVTLIEKVPWLAKLKLTLNYELDAATQARLKKLGVTRLAIEPKLARPFEEE